jgi:hypothetical protein
VSELGEGIAHLVVDGALAYFAAFDMGNGNAQSESGRCGRKHFVAVGDQQQQIGAPGGEGVGQAQDGEADGLGHARVSVGAEQALDAGLDRKTVALDFLDGQAELGREMRPEYEDAQLDGGVGGELAQRPIEMTVVRARSGDDADAAARRGCIRGGRGCANGIHTHARELEWRVSASPVWLGWKSGTSDFS